MKKYLSIAFFSILICFSNTAHGQMQLRDSIRFDNYSSTTQNDFTNHFISGTGYTQIPDSGITGGCIRTPATISWGNDNAVYCTRLKAVQWDECDLSVCFLFDTTTLNNINADHSAALWLSPSADASHSIIIECKQHGISITTFNGVGDVMPCNLIHNHWYMFGVNFVFTSIAPEYIIGLTDLGITGDTMTSNGWFNFYEVDSIFALDPAISISISGSSYGGVKYFDNFSFWGDTAYSNCINSSIASTADPSADVLITNSHISIHSDYSPFSAAVYNLSGQLIFSTDLSHYFEKDFTNLAKGIYVLKVRTKDAVRTYKFVVTN